VIRAIRSRVARLGDSNRGLFLPLFGFPVRVNPSFWFVAVITGLLAERSASAVVEWVIVLLPSILLHELGHAAVASRWGTVTRINVHGAGGTTTWTSLWSVVWWKYVAVSLAGPVAGLLIGTAASLLPAPTSPILRLALRDLVWINVGWGLFNLLPTLPLDGGHALRAALVRYVPKRGETLTAGAGLIVATAGGLVAIGLEQQWALLILGLCGLWNFEVLRLAHENRSRSEWRTVSDGEGERERY
jgi:Zn-dependent protease